MKELKGYKGMMGTHSYYENHSTPDGIYMAHIENGEIVFDDYMTR